MKIEIEATLNEFEQLVSIVKGKQGLATIHDQLQNAIPLFDDSQKGEIPKEGDMPIIKRAE
jgi:hypothetical protein